MRIAACVLILLGSTACSESPPEPHPQDAVVPATNSARAVAALTGRSPFSGAVFANETLYLSGQSDVDPATGSRSSDPAESTRQAMDNVGAILSSAELDYSHLVSCRLQLADMDDYQAVNTAYASYFTDSRYPARTTVQVKELVDGGGIEVTCIAYKDSAATEVVRPPADEIPPALGPYSPAVMAGNMLYLSGQGGRDPLTDQISNLASEQTDRTIATIETTLRAADLSVGSVVAVNSYYPHSRDSEEIQTRMARAFVAGAAPARAHVPVGRLPGDIAVEITVTAARGRYSVTRLYPVGEPSEAASSPAVLVDDTLYLETVAAADTTSSLEDQLQSIVAQHKRNLALADMDLADVVYADIYLRDIADQGALTTELEKYFLGTPPAATIIGVGADAEARVMIGLIAAL